MNANLLEIFDMRMCERTEKQIGFFFFNPDCSGENTYFSWVNSYSSHVMRNTRANNKEIEFGMTTRKIRGTTMYIVTLRNGSLFRNHLTKRQIYWTNLIFDVQSHTDLEYICFFSVADRDAFFRIVSRIRQCFICNAACNVGCANCRIPYCSAVHQNADWEAHKILCKCVN